MHVFRGADGDVLKDPLADDVGLINREAVAGARDDLALEHGHERAGAGEHTAGVVQLAVLT